MFGSHGDIEPDHVTWFGLCAAACHGSTSAVRLIDPVAVPGWLGSIGHTLGSPARAVDDASYATRPDLGALVVRLEGAA